MSECVRECEGLGHIPTSPQPLDKHFQSSGHQAVFTTSHVHTALIPIFYSFPVAEAALAANIAALKKPRAAASRRGMTPRHATGPRGAIATHGLVPRSHGPVLARVAAVRTRMPPVLLVDFAEVDEGDVRVCLGRCGPLCFFCANGGVFSRFSRVYPGASPTPLPLSHPRLSLSLTHASPSPRALVQRPADVDASLVANVTAMAKGAW